MCTASSRRRRRRQAGDDGAEGAFGTEGAFGDPDAAHHYAYRDERLWPFSEHEFGCLFAR